jgi:hypothetical protein
LRIFARRRQKKILRKVYEGLFFYSEKICKSRHVLRGKNSPYFTQWARQKKNVILEIFPLQNWRKFGKIWFSSVNLN